MIGHVCEEEGEISEKEKFRGKVTGKIKRFAKNLFILHSKL